MTPPRIKHWPTWAKVLNLLLGCNAWLVFILTPQSGQVEFTPMMALLTACAALSLALGVLWQSAISALVLFPMVLLFNVALTREGYQLGQQSWLQLCLVTLSILGYLFITSTLLSNNYYQSQSTPDDRRPIPPEKKSASRTHQRRYIRMHLIFSSAAILVPFALLLKVHTSPSVQLHLKQFYPNRVASIQIIMSLAVLCLSWVSFVYVFKALLQEDRRGFSRFRSGLIALEKNQRSAMIRVSLIIFAIGTLFGISSWLNH